jgi:photosystem II stability/assembly factor-like uncharacterized protein
VTQTPDGTFYCEHCGAPLPVGSAFCGSCGASTLDDFPTPDPSVPSAHLDPVQNPDWPTSLPQMPGEEPSFTPPPGQPPKDPRAAGGGSSGNHGKRRRQWLVVGLVVLLIGSAVTFIAVRPSKGSTLRVAVVNLPHDSKALIEVTLPNGSDRSLSGSGELTAGSGIYSLAVSPVHVKTDHYFPTKTHQVIHVAAGQMRKVTVDYADIVPATTVVLSSSELAAGTSPSNNRLNLAVGTPILSVGQVVVAGITPMTPEGLLVKVVSVVTSDTSQVADVVTSDTGQMVNTVPATLPEAMPRGQLSATFPIGQTPTATPVDYSPSATATASLENYQPQRVGSADASLIVDKTLAEMNFDYGQHFTDRTAAGIPGCTDEGETSLASVEFTPNVKATFTISAHIDASWGFSAHPTFHFWVTASESLDAGMDANASATCSIQHDWPDPAVILGEFPIDIGIPVVIVSKGQWDAAIDGALTGQAQVSAGESGSFTGGLAYTGGHFSPIKTDSFTPHSVASASLSADVSITTGPSLDFDINDIAGPYLTANGELQAIDTVGSGSANENGVYISAHVTAGMKMDLFGLTNVSHDFGNLITWGPRLLWYPGESSAPSTNITTVASSWTSVPSSGGLSGLSDLFTVRCPTVTTCFAVGQTTSGSGVVATSSDSGTTWSEQNLPPNVGGLEGLYCLNASTCLASGWNTDDVGIVLDTTDGGATWSLQLLPGGATIGDGIACATPTSCLVLAGAPGEAVIAHSSGPAGPWLVVNTVQNANWIDGVACPTANLCLAEALGYNGNQAFSLSRDGGSTWTVAGAPPNTKWLVSLACPTSTSCLAADDLNDGTTSILSTIDGGSIWNQIPTPINNGNLSLVCTSASMCLAAGWTNGSAESDCPSWCIVLPQSGASAAILQTTNGTTWQQEELPQGIEGITSVDCPSTKLCVAVGLDSNQNVVFLLSSGL